MDELLLSIKFPQYEVPCYHQVTYLKLQELPMVQDLAHLKLPSNLFVLLQLKHLLEIQVYQHPYDFQKERMSRYILKYQYANDYLYE